MQYLFHMLCSFILANGLDIKKHLYTGLIINKEEGKFFGNGEILFLLVEQSVRSRVRIPGQACDQDVLLYCFSLVHPHSIHRDSPDFFALVKARLIISSHLNA